MLTDVSVLDLKTRTNRSLASIDIGEKNDTRPMYLYTLAQIERERERERERGVCFEIDFNRKGGEYFYSLSLIDRTADITANIHDFLFFLRVYRSVTKPNFRHSNVTRAERDLSAEDEEVTDTV